MIGRAVLPGVLTIVIREETMQHQSATRPLANRALRTICLILGLSLLLPVSQAFGQQTYVGRFDVYAGYAYLNSPLISLAENGVQAQFGVRVWPWLSLGFDFSDETGNATITPNLLTASLQQQLGAELQGLAAEGVIPANYTLVVPLHSQTQTYAAGPQFSYHGLSRATLFIRPSVGIIHETGTPHPNPADPVAVGIVAQLAPSDKVTESVIFYGFGGGVDLNITKHVALRIQGDFVHDHLFSDLLASGRNTVRVSIGPAFQFGKNVVK
jgi:hypothetical protein